jgi:selenocysteine insertion sequence-binding protein 2
LLIADTESSANDDLDSCIDLHNLLTEDDLEDEECMEESISDVRELASKYGEVVTIDVLKVDDDSFLRIRFGGDTSIAVKAVEGFRGMVVGGQIVNASLSGRDKEQSNDNKIDVSKNSGDKRKPDAETKTNLEKKARTDDKAPLYSGDKLIPERFAEMKRAPKIPNAAGPRDYANTTNDERVRPLLAEMLRELMRLQKRAVEDKNAKARRRMVMGLREVARGIRAHKGMLNNIMKIHRLYL